MVTVLANKKGNLMVSLRERFSRQAGENRHKGRCHHPPATEYFANWQPLFLTMRETSFKAGMKKAK